MYLVVRLYIWMASSENKLALALKHPWRSHQIKTWIVPSIHSKIGDITNNGCITSKRTWFLIDPVAGFSSNGNCACNRDSRDSMNQNTVISSNNNQGCPTHPKMSGGKKGQIKKCKIRFTSFHPKVGYHLHPKKGVLQRQPIIGSFLGPATLKRPKLGAYN